MTENNSLKQCICGCGDDDMFHEMGGCFGRCFTFEGGKMVRMKQEKKKIEVKPKPYELPKYAIMVNALELGYLMGLMAKHNIDKEARKFMPTFWKRVDALVESFYEPKK